MKLTRYKIMAFIGYCTKGTSLIFENDMQIYAEDKSQVTPQNWLDKLRNNIFSLDTII